MAINISARPIILTIGSQDWSQWIDFEAGIQIGYPEYQLGSGLLVVSGSISLKFGENSLSILPSSPYYRFNVSQWKRGQTLSIRVDGSFIPCSGQQLFILKAPQSPKKDINGMQTLTLEIGCRLALNNFPPEPSRNIAGVVAGQPTNRSTIIQRILDYIAVPNSISPMPYDIDYPLPKTDGNWIQFAGKIADSAGYHLRCDNTGIVRNYPNNITVGANDFAYTIGSDEKLWQSIGDISEQPIERLIVTGVKQNVKPVEDLFNNPIVDEELGTFIEIAPDLPVSQQQPFTLTVKSSTTKRVEAKQSVSPIINSSVQRDLIIQEIEEKIEPLIAIAPNLPVSQNEPFLLTTSLIKTKTYFLLKGVVQALVEATDEPIIKIAPDLPVAQQQPFLLTTSSITRSTWVKRDDGKWNKTVIIEKPFILLAPDLPVSQNEPFLLTIASQSTSVDTSGAPTSSSLGFEISENTIEEQQLTVDVFAAQLVDDPFRERQRTIDVPYASNEGQLFAYGSAYNKFLSGRAFGWQLGGTYRPIEPFSQVAVVDGNIIYYLKADAIQYAFNGTEAYVLLNGIEVGVASIGAPNTITPPVLIPLGSFSILGESIANIINSAIAFDNLIGMSYAQSTWVIPISFDPILGMSYAEINYNALVFDIAIGMSYAHILNPNVVSSAYKAYWAMDSIVSGFTANALGNPTYNLPVSNGTETIGIVNNGIADISAILPTTVPDLFWDLFTKDFVGFALWIKPDFVGGAGNITQILSEGSGFGRSWYLTLDVDLATITLSAFRSGFGDVSVSDLVIDGWNLVICEMNKTAGTITIKVNNGTKQIFSSPITGRASQSLEFEAFLITVDEVFFFGAPLTTVQESAIWNGGIGSAYPPF